MRSREGESRSEAEEGGEFVNILREGESLNRLEEGGEFVQNIKQF